MIKNFLMAFALLLSASFAGAQPGKWFNLKRGKAAHSFSFKDDGTLTYVEKPFKYRILVPDGDRKFLVPTGISISSANPSGEYVILQASNRYLDFRCCWLLDLTHFTVTDINRTHYGPARWVAWSPDNRFAILEDPEAQILQRVELSTGQVVELQVTGYWGGPQGMTLDNTRSAIESRNEYEQINLKSFYCITGTQKFIVRVDVKYYNKFGIDHSFSVEADLQSGQTWQLR